VNKLPTGSADCIVCALEWMEESKCSLQGRAGGYVNSADMLLSGYLYACIDFFFKNLYERHVISGFVALVFFSVSINSAYGTNF